MITTADQPPAFICSAPSFHDGDNIRCAGGGEMRLARVDAPEVPGSPRCAPGRRRSATTSCDFRAGLAARDHLRAIAAGRTVTCRIVDALPRSAGFQATDSYGRPVVRCSAEGVGDLSEAQVRDGFGRRW